MNDAASSGALKSPLTLPKDTCKRAERRYSLSFVVPARRLQAAIQTAQNILSSYRALARKDAR